MNGRQVTIFTAASAVQDAYAQGVKAGAQEAQQAAGLLRDCLRHLFPERDGEFPNGEAKYTVRPRPSRERLEAAIRYLEEAEREE